MSCQALTREGVVTTEENARTLAGLAGPDVDIHDGRRPQAPDGFMDGVDAEAQVPGDARLAQKAASLFRQELHDAVVRALIGVRGEPADERISFAGSARPDGLVQDDLLTEWTERVSDTQECQVYGFCDTGAAEVLPGLPPAKTGDLPD